MENITDCLTGAFRVCLLVADDVVVTRAFSELFPLIHTIILDPSLIFVNRKNKLLILKTPLIRKPGMAQILLSPLGA